ncbi:MAG TPA: CHAT domain-containing protein [Herpetosiphon sp.]|uniref:Tetratricopeptide TPR_2 repeat protein n=1 Tax=Herpetosiphon aurantiacus (strain ATCC 23779 / DSM 785 / 114-95) TaxID=316274 RepID=A9AWF0_HERA2|nr:tetratricopeptide repeat protein [Herpetosiphon sp.]ABX06709.1 Tetratricopeptide TPR_2 repeat protein [Herpetosiphon aurantiacus DSM 785]HBW52213.1 CHAT domain-containing protein [Herpetosiphon sp.]
MSQPNILTLECTAAAADSPDLAQWTLRLNQLTASGLLPALPTKEQRADFQWYFERYLDWPFLEFRERAMRVEAELATVGKALFAAIFESSANAAKIYAEWMQVDAGVPTLQILSLIPAVLSVPWELLHDDFGFLNQRRINPVAIYRTVSSVRSKIVAQQFAMPLRVLVVVARPDDQNFLDPRSSAQTIFGQLQQLENDQKLKPGMIELEFLRPPTYDQLARRLQDATKPVHILHFDGHGGFPKIQPTSTLYKSANVPQGVLSFEKADYQVDTVEARRFAELLNGAGVRLVLLDACQTSVMDTSASDDAEYQRQQALSSVATQLLTAGVPAVVAMSASVIVPTTALFFGELYGLIAEGQSVPVALERARQALQSQPVRLYLARNAEQEPDPISLADWWLPHFYQQAAINLTPTGKPARSKPTKLSGFIENPHQRPFVGRAKELLQLERALLKGKIALLHGFGGIGKTRLASEAAAWLTQTKLYQGALLLSFEHGGNQIALLSAIARHYELPETDSHDLQAALKRFKPHLHNKPLLIIADNLESILPNAGNVELNVLEAQERQALWDCVLGLRQAGAGIILTCRDYDLRDSRLQQGQYTSVIAMRGLDTPSAYSFATALLDDLAIDRRRAPKLQLSSLLARLDHHPLAMGLTLRALRDPALSIEQLLSDYSSALLQYTDETSPNQRHSSLEASLNYSLQRLSPEQREWLAKLAPFEGGASEDDLLVITEIPAEQWAQLRASLEHAALIVPVAIPGFEAPFLRFHPTLTPYLRQQHPASTELEQRFAVRYYGLSGYCYQQDRQNPQAVRALVRYELPNLQRAIQGLLRFKEIPAAVNMSDNLNKFYNNFGMQRERNLLNRQIAPYISSSEQLSEAEYLYESELGEVEYSQGHYELALKRFQQLLARIEQQLPDQLLNFQHCITLTHIGRCLQRMGQSTQSQRTYEQALAVIEQLLNHRLDDRDYLKQQALLITALADCHTDQGQFAQAKSSYEQALEIKKTIDDRRGQAVSLGQLGLLALRQRQYAEATQKYNAALAIYQQLNEPSIVASIYHQLGRVAEKQKNWTIAENYYRQSLTIKEGLHNNIGVAETCNQLALLAKSAGRSIEAEGWFKRALQNPDLPVLNRAKWLNNLADLLADQIQAGTWSQSRLAEAQNYAEQALNILKGVDPAQASLWLPLNILANLADPAGQAAEYCQQARIAYAAHAANRWHIDQQFGDLIAAIVTATQGNQEVRTAVEQTLPQLEANGWKISKAIQRIWAGERDWHGLCAELDNQDSLLILRVLEELEANSEGKSQKDKG